MRLVHMADLHLGFRQYQAKTRNGLNQREVDVETALARVIDKTIELHPDIIVIAGDVFHAVRPPNHAIDNAYRQFMRLKAALPATDVVMIAGNHDTPKTTDVGYILPLFDTLGLHVARSTTMLSLRGGELSVLCVPDHARPKPELVPDPSARYNVLLIHDQVQGESRRYGPAKKPGETVDPSELNAPAFDYVALGDYHVYQEIAPNAFYSGSIEYTSSNIWREVDEEAKQPEGCRGKGIIERNLATGEHRFHLIPPAREIVDLPPICGAAITPAALTDAICAVADGWPGGIDDKVVRLVVTDVPKHVVRDLDHRRIRQLKARALNFLLDTRIPEEVIIRGVGDRAARRRLPLNELVGQMLDEREVAPGVDRDALKELAMFYLGEVDKQGAGVSEAPEAPVSGPPMAEVAA